MVLAPAYFFTRIETAREQADSEQWRALAVAGEASRTGRLPTPSATGLGRGFEGAFRVSSGGTDEYGISREAGLFVTDAEGRKTVPDGGMESLLREASGVVRSLPEGTDGTCTSRDGVKVVCGWRSGSGITGVVFTRRSMDIPPFGPLAFWIAGAAGLFAFARRRGVSRLSAGLAGAVSGGASAMFLSLDSSRIVEAATAAEQALATTMGELSGTLPLHQPDTSAGFVAFVIIACAVVVAGLHRPTSRLLGNLRDRPMVYAAIAPAMLGMILLIFVPFFMGVYLAFLDNDRNFVGLANFIEILFPDGTSDTNFYFTLGVTIMWTVLNVVLHVAIGLALALVLSDSRMRGRAWYRVLLIVPWAVPNYITALVWKWIFNTQYGPANAFLALVGLNPVDWLGRSFITNFTANLVTNTWLGFPFMMVVALGALQSIPKDLYEAAEMDGAGRLARFRNVTLPLLKPALFPAIILGSIWTFNMFNVVYLVSGGAPDNQSNILITEAYRAFRVLKNFGMAAAYSLIIFVILAVYTALTNRMTKAAESVFE